MRLTLVLQSLHDKRAVVFLVSPEPGWITAQTLTVDDGRMDYLGHG
jgi:NAD(P)-dependent dehydrogenase (short-subunit alcohol dehydrogenase family)